MAVYCRKCANQRELPKSAIRTSPLPCQFCGGFDQIMRRRKKRQGNSIVLIEVPTNLNNFSFPDHLIDGMPGNVNQQADREYEGQTEA